MIRLPLSSISLSPVDVECSLQQADIYYGLLRQGFKKHDIARYLNDYRQAQAEANGLTCTDFNLAAPSTFELTSQRAIPHPQEEEDQTQDAWQTGSTIKNAFSEVGSRSTSYGQDIEGQECRVEVHHEDNRSPSPKTTVPTMRVNKHAPRKSSLLRFFRAASPEKQSSEVHSESVVGSSKHTTIKNPSRRSLTHFWRTAEVEDYASDTTAKILLTDQLRRLSLESTSRPSEHAAELPALVLPPPLSDTYTFHDNSDLGTNEDFDGLGDLSDADQAHRSCSLLCLTEHSTYLPSSPPIPDASPIETPSSNRAESASPEFPVTPTPVRNASGFPHTEPRQYRHLCLDGRGFPVYNDSLPAVSQPQTPADLLRGPFVTEHDAAYTAPPGMLLAGPGSVSMLDNGRWDHRIGEQSPTARAISLRERRNRELQRSVRAEGIRLQRLRLRDEAMFTQGTFAAGPPDGDGTGERPQAMAEALQDAWRDDLDADRVGDENFEVELLLLQPRGMRIVSGNARLDAWEGEVGR
ncbi:uncharacterized protein PV06_02398 [Exophiala oligosperma]|uniref:Uncharacterized protein n=2 Tax=Chaetothyriales TaxID=34395 RepID=A0A0D2EFP1_9EURO|nr:uncharacterized protein PV06_02398 [Exophiala oligosperma]KAJ9640664.1 hypothetical protein H2204_003293 [Knufia peltigerae]KIW46754.1 hypothetical protein PV06_02398 [Exophiala oligosperma]